CGIGLAILFTGFGSAGPAHAGFTTTLTASSVTEPDGTFLYEYLLTNMSESGLNAVSLLLSISDFANLGSITGTSGWDVTYSPGDPAISWEATDVAFGLPPGSSASFSFISPLGPALSDYFVVGIDDMGTIIEFNQGQIAGPGANPVP